MKKMVRIQKKNILQVITAAVLIGLFFYNAATPVLLAQDHHNHQNAIHTETEDIADFEQIHEEEYNAIQSFFAHSLQLF